MIADPVATQTRTAAPAGSTTASATGIADLQTFLVMLTAQIRNQDPLKPLDSSDFAVQLATFSGVEQQVKTNQLLEAVSSQMALSGLGDLAGWVGMEARVTAPVAFTGTPLTLAPSPKGGADRTVLVTYDAQNREVSREVVPVTSQPLVWSGKGANGNVLPAGLYSFRLESYKGEDLLGASPVGAFGLVGEVRAGPSGPVVVLVGGSEVPASQVTALRFPALSPP
jgi:flagellar basal-body rod modification protein FlgD